MSLLLMLLCLLLKMLLKDARSVTIHFFVLFDNAIEYVLIWALINK